MSLPIEQYVDQVAKARQTARRVQVFAAISWAFGWIVIVACLIAWLGFQVSLIDTLDVVLAIGVGGLLGGVGFYATSRSLGIAASRLEIDIATKLGKP